MILQVSFRELTYPTIGIFNFGAEERATLDQEDMIFLVGLVDFQGLVMVFLLDSLFFSG